MSKSKIETELPADPIAESKKLRELLWRMQEEADEAWRNVDPKSGAERDLALRAEVEDLLGPSAWDALGPTTHIVWDERAICHWTPHVLVRWPPTQTAVKISDLIVRLRCEEDETFVEFVTRPDVDWGGVTCDTCRIRLPTLLRELSLVLDDLHEGIMEGHRAHPETIRARESYAREVGPELTAEQRQRHAVQAEENNARDARRAARRQRTQTSRGAVARNAVAKSEQS
jgi:hypothetical protein